MSRPRSGMNWREIRDRLAVNKSRASSATITKGESDEVQSSYQDYLKSPEWAVARRFMLAYYDHRCALCNEHKNLHVHHRSYANIYTETHRDLIVLCRRCHTKFHN